MKSFFPDKFNENHKAWSLGIQEIVRLTKPFDSCHPCQPLQTSAKGIDSYQPAQTSAKSIDSYQPAQTSAKSIDACQPA